MPDARGLSGSHPVRYHLRRARSIPVHKKHTQLTLILYCPCPSGTLIDSGSSFDPSAWETEEARATTDKVSVAISVGGCLLHHDTIGDQSRVACVRRGKGTSTRRRCADHDPMSCCGMKRITGANLRAASIRDWSSQSTSPHSDKLPRSADDVDLSEAVDASGRSGPADNTLDGLNEHL